MNVQFVRPDGDADEGLPRRRKLRAVGALPTLMTLGNLIFGFAAVYFCMRGVMTGGNSEIFVNNEALPGQVVERLLPTWLALSAYFVFFAMICDTLDGRLARLTRRTSDFGGQLDSLADMVSFGVAPAMMMIALIGRQVQLGQLTGDWLVTPLGEKFGRAIWLMGAAYVACVAIRLARYNVEIIIAKNAANQFRGLPSPGGAASMCSIILLHEWIAGTSGDYAWLVKALPVVAVTLAVLMVSRIPYVHFANVYLRRRQPVTRVWMYLAGAFLVILAPQFALPVLANVYAASGPVMWLFQRFTGWVRPIEHHDETAPTQNHTSRTG